MKRFFPFCFLLLLPTVSEALYTPPIGIPKPSFGVEEVAPPDPVPWNSTVTGFYYICPTCSGAIDTNNPNGWPTKPRVTIPIPFFGGTGFPAGSRVILEGDFTSGHMGNRYIRCNGTQAAPCFIGGRDSAHRAHFNYQPPTVDSSANGLQLTGTYTIYENIFEECDHGSTNTYCGGIILAVYSLNGVPQTPMDHVVLRHSEVYGSVANNAPNNHRNASAVFGADRTHMATYIVMWDNHLHHTGVPQDLYDNTCANRAPLSHGINITGWVDHVWVLNSELDHHAGDGVQVNAAPEFTGVLDATRYIFVGGNDSHHNVQYGMGSKQSMDAVFASNNVHDSLETCYATACFYNMYGAIRSWYLFNTCHDSLSFFRVSEGGSNPGNLFTLDNYPASDHYIIGNVVWNLHMPAGWSDTPHVCCNTDPFNSSARSAVISLTDSNNIFRHFLNNSFYGFDGGVYPGTLATGSLEFKNNIWWGGPKRQWWFLYQALPDTTSQANGAGTPMPFLSKSSWDYNLFASTVTSNGQPIVWGKFSSGTASFTDPTDFHTNSYVASNPNNLYSPAAATHQGAHDVMSDPLFVNAGTGNLHLGSGSPAINAGDNVSLQTALTTFNNLYGVTINTDIDGYLRFQGTGSKVDMGAYETGGAAGTAISVNITSAATATAAAYTMAGGCVGCASAPIITVNGVNLGAASGTSPWTSWTKTVTLNPGNNNTSATGTDASSNATTASKVVKLTGGCGP